MELTVLAGLRHAATASASNNPAQIADALQAILNGSRSFTHVEEVIGSLGTVFVFLQESCCDDAVPLPPCESEAGSVARRLCERSVRSEVRYPPCPHPDRVKGWRIRQVRIRGKYAAIAEAAWV